MRRAALLFLALAAIGAAGCRQDMHNQPKIKAQAANPFFPDGRGGRPLVEGTVARSAALEETPYLTGKDNGQFVRQAPLALTEASLARGRERFNVFCSPCHGRVGTGEGMIVQRGYKQPQTFHSERLRGEADGYFFNAITNGFGVMPNYAQQVPVADRWAITLYIRALQLSQHAALDDVPEAERATLGTGTEQR
jgi:mono/diheme cytochrome c family protein